MQFEGAIERVCIRIHLIALSAPSFSMSHCNPIGGQILYPSESDKNVDFDNVYLLIPYDLLLVMITVIPENVQKIS